MKISKLTYRRPSLFQPIWHMLVQLVRSLIPNSSFIKMFLTFRRDIKCKTTKYKIMQRHLSPQNQTSPNKTAFGIDHKMKSNYSSSSAEYLKPIFSCNRSFFSSAVIVTNYKIITEGIAATEYFVLLQIAVDFLYVTSC